MSTNKAGVDRNQRILLDLIGKPGNDVCADCKAKGPRWASHNLGIFLCVSCASIHRKIGTHVTKVKSVTMDSWTKEQLEVMKSTGNLISNAKYNPNESRHPPPVNREDSERASEMEKYIRSKYEFKRFMVKPRDQLLSAEKANPVPRKSSPVPPAPAKVPAPSGTQPQAQIAPSSPFQSLTSSPSNSPQTGSTFQSSAATVPANSVWNDLMSLSGTSTQLSTSPTAVPLTPALASTVASPVAGAAVSPDLPSVPISNTSMMGNTTYTGVSGVSANTIPLQPTQSQTQGLHPSSVPGQTTSFIQQGTFVGSHPFAQHNSVFHTSIGVSTPYSLPYSQSSQTQVGAAQASALGFSQPYLQQQNPIPNQGYPYAQSGFIPSPDSQQVFQPYHGHPGNDMTYLQWQQTQSNFSSTSQYNQWTS